MFLVLFFHFRRSLSIKIYIHINEVPFKVQYVQHVHANRNSKEMKYINISRIIFVHLLASIPSFAGIQSQNWENVTITIYPMTFNQLKIFVEMAISNRNAETNKTRFCYINNVLIGRIQLHILDNS